MDIFYCDPSCGCAEVKFKGNCDILKTVLDCERFEDGLKNDQWKGGKYKEPEWLKVHKNLKSLSDFQLKDVIPGDGAFRLLRR